MSQAGLSGTIPTCIGEMTSLRCLWLFGNLFVGQIPDSIGNLTSLISMFELLRFLITFLKDFSTQPN